MKKHNLDYASLCMNHTVTVCGTNYISFSNHKGQQILVRSGDQFRSLLRTIEVAKQNQGVQYETQ